MLAALSRKHIATAGRLGSGPALGPEEDGLSLPLCSLSRRTGVRARRCLTWSP